MTKQSLSLKDSINLERLGRAQAPLRQMAKDLNIPEVDGQYDFRPLLLQSRADKRTIRQATLRLERDKIVTVISSLIMEEHFSPYRMAVFASTEIHAAALRAQLLTWIHYASRDLRRTSEQLINNGYSLVSWYRQLLGDHPKEADRLEEITYIAGLVTTYYHPHADYKRRYYILRLLRKLAVNGSHAASSIHELLTSHLGGLVSFEALEQNHPTIEGVPTTVCFRLVEDLYEHQIKNLATSRTTQLSSTGAIKEIISNTDPTEPLKIIVAGTFSELYSVYCLYLLLSQQVAQIGSPQIYLDIGISDMTFYVMPTQMYVKRLRQWFNETRLNVPGLGYLVHSTAQKRLQDLPKTNSSFYLPTDEELVLFYLRTLSRTWNAQFMNHLGRPQVTKRYAKMMLNMESCIPKEWKTATKAYHQLCDFLLSKQQDLGLVAEELQPINLLTDSQINDATLILTASQLSRNQLVQRFSGGAAGKTIALGHTDASAFTSDGLAIESPYSPPSFFFAAKWDTVKERHITEIFRKHIVSPLKERPEESVKLIRLIELKPVSKEAIEAVKQYVAELQQHSLRGDDQILRAGLIFLLAVRTGVEPLSDKWEHLITRYENHREHLQDTVFDGKSRVLPDYAAIEFLRQYLGPRRYVDMEFTGIYQQCNEMMLDLLVKRLARPL